jgi:hypothetical protein
VAAAGAAQCRSRPKNESNMSALKKVPVVVWLVVAFAALITIGVTLS